MRVRRIGGNCLERRVWSEKHFGYVWQEARARLVLVRVRGILGMRRPRFARVWRRDDWRTLGWQ
jgi:hypothetical protein